jgi:hypothetical protein
VEGRRDEEEEKHAGIPAFWMALETKQEFCVVCGNFRVTESTGTYDADTNATGYGTPNPDFGAVTPYTVAFYPPGATEPVYTLDLYVDTPAADADGHYVWNITPEAFGVTTLKSGVWKLTVTYGTTVKNICVLVYDDLEARIKGCVCTDTCNVDLWAELQAAKLLFGKFKNDEAQKMIDRLYRDTECCWKGCGC